MESPAPYPATMRLARAVHSSFSAWLILGLSLLATLGAYLLSEHFVRQRAEDRFLFRTEELQEAISTRLYLYEQLLWSGVALMNASTEVTREDFRLFVTTLDINKHWPGIQGMGLSLVVPPERRQAFIASVQAEGFPEFSIKPEEERDFYTAVMYLEPFDWRNQRAFGFDMFSNPVRRAAMERARDTGQAATSGLITLVQETNNNIQAGFLTYLPVYTTKSTPPTVEQRRAELVGWIYGPFRMTDLMQGILGNREKLLQFKIYDGVESRAESLLYSSYGPDIDPDSLPTPLFTKTVQLELQGRPWILTMHSTHEPDANGEQDLPRYVAVAGIVIDLLLFYVIFSLHFINRRAEALADIRTQELEEARSSLEHQVATRTAELEQTRSQLEQSVQERTRLLREKLHELETLNMVTVGREERILALKAEVNELSVQLGKSPPYDSIQ